MFLQMQCGTKEFPDGIVKLAAGSEEDMREYSSHNHSHLFLLNGNESTPVLLVYSTSQLHPLLSGEWLLALRESMNQLFLQENGLEAATAVVNEASNFLAQYASEPPRTPAASLEPRNPTISMALDAVASDRYRSFFSIDAVRKRSVEMRNSTSIDSMPLASAISSSAQLPFGAGSNSNILADRPSFIAGEISAVGAGGDHHSYLDALQSAMKTRDRGALREALKMCKELGVGSQGVLKEGIALLGILDEDHTRRKIERRQSREKEVLSEGNPLFQEEISPLESNAIVAAALDLEGGVGSGALALCKSAAMTRDRGQLKAALTAAQVEGIEGVEVDAARQLLEEVERDRRALKALKQAVASQELAALEEALALAKAAGERVIGSELYLSARAAKKASKKNIL